MSDAIFFDGKKYISANEASLSAGFTRDYIARLCRDGKVRGRRIGKNWYVEGGSLQSFLVGQEYAKSLRSESLSHERRLEYRGLESPDSSAVQIPSPETFSRSLSAMSDRAGESRAASDAAPLADRADAIKAKMASALAAQSEKTLSHISSVVSAPTGFTHAVLQTAHVPAYTITPVAEFFHKLVALTLAFMLTFGTYALVDPRAAHFAGESAKDTARSLRTTYDSLTGGGVQNLVANVQSQVALAAENPSATFAAASAALTT